MSTDDLPFDEALGVWLDLERALAGTHGFGGDTAEIYAYRLLPESIRHVGMGAGASMEPTVQAAAARTAARNLTSILRHFVELHEGVVIELDQPGGFQVQDLTGEGCAPFLHRVHVRVSQEQRIRAQFARDLLALWSRASDAKLPEPDFARWSGTTKDLLIMLGLEYSHSTETYVFRRIP